MPFFFLSSESLSSSFALLDLIFCLESFLVFIESFLESVLDFLESFFVCLESFALRLLLKVPDCKSKVFKLFITDSGIF
ncbi:hypothetical protein HERIO_2033 [Hepatospora eriocheir]|uniref:Uncharacterized protein n=1 Tax=Hepatospora eriocheir TaxID=1081669 RepID=A0A1X0Q882_9MICR|nr:hypothetical protein HERIO_2033 [Hepatospora eriocheir]